VWYSKAKDYSIHSSAEWSCRKDEHDTDGKSMKHAQWCRVRTIILGRDSGYNMLPGQSITFSALDDKTPHEVWSAKKPSLQHLRVFGCDSYVHVPKENGSKLDKNDEKCIFIGYKDGVKGYKLWNPETKKIVYSRDVVFREVKDVSKQEFLPTQDKPEKIELELDDAKSKSSEEEEAEEEEKEEPHTPVLRRSVRDERKPERYSPPDFRSNFSLSITDDDPRTVREAVNSEDSKL
jgi:hypothetical protein